jgi:hypothetical protein
MKNPASFQIVTMMIAQSRFRLAQPIDRGQTEKVADLVQHTQTRRVKEQPQVGGSDHRQDRRGKVGGAHEAACRDLGIGPERHRKCNEDRHRDRDTGVEQVVLDHEPEGRVGEQIGVIFGANEFGGVAPGAA